MEQSDEILMLLAEIRDLQREHLAEYRRVIEEHRRANEEAIRINKETTEKGLAQHRASLKTAKATTWAMFVLIAICVAANLFMLHHMAGVQHMAGGR